MNKSCGMSDEHGIASSSADHAQHCKPHFRQVLRRKAAISNAQHVRHSLEQSPAVLLVPWRSLEKRPITIRIKCAVL